MFNNCELIALGFISQAKLTHLVLSLLYTSRTLTRGKCIIRLSNNAALIHGIINTTENGLRT